MYAKAKECSDILSVEDFAILLAKHFVSFYQKVGDWKSFISISTSFSLFVFVVPLSCCSFSASLFWAEHFVLNRLLTSHLPCYSRTKCNGFEREQVYKFKFSVRYLVLFFCFAFMNLNSKYIGKEPKFHIDERFAKTVYHFIS